MHAFYSQITSDRGQTNPYFRLLVQLTHLQLEQLEILKSKLVWNTWAE